MQKFKQKIRHSPNLERSARTLVVIMGRAERKIDGSDLFFCSDAEGIRRRIWRYINNSRITDKSAKASPLEEYCWTKNG